MQRIYSRLLKRQALRPEFSYTFVATNELERTSYNTVNKLRINDLTSGYSSLPLMRRVQYHTSVSVWWPRKNITYIVMKIFEKDRALGEAIFLDELLVSLPGNASRRILRSGYFNARRTGRVKMVPWREIAGFQLGYGSVRQKGAIPNKF